MSFYQRMPILIIGLLFFLLVPKIILGSEVKKNTSVEVIFESDLKAEIKKNTFTIINFWATWCIPCIQEIPELEKIKKDFSDKSVGVVFVNVAEDKKDVLKFLKKNKMNFESFYVNSDVPEKLDFQTLPYSFLIKNDLKIVDVMRGSHDYSSFSKLLQKHISPKK